MKRFFRIGAAAVVAVLLLGSISCSNAFFVKKEAPDLLNQIKYEGTLGGSGTKDDPYIVKGSYTVKMPEAIDKGDYKICVYTRSDSNYSGTEVTRVAVPLVADNYFEDVWDVATVTDANGSGQYNFEGVTKKTIYLKIPHITDEKEKTNGYTFSNDGKTLVCEKERSSYKVKTTFDVKAEEDGEDEYGKTLHYCTLTLKNIEISDRGGEWESMYDDLPAFLKKAQKFNYSTSNNDDGFIFSNSYEWNDESPLSENLTFYEIEGDSLVIFADAFYEFYGKDLIYFGKLESDKTTFTGKDFVANPEYEEEYETTVKLPTEFKGKLGEKYGKKALELTVNGATDTRGLTPMSIAAFVNHIIDIS